MAAEQRSDPYTGFRFLVEVNSVIVAGFSEVSGIEAEITTEEYQEGGVNTYTHKLPNHVDHPNLVLRRGLTDSLELWDWFQETIQNLENGTVTPKNVRIVVLDSVGNESRAWEFLRAYPVKWTGPDLNAGQGEVAVESLELVHRGPTGEGS